MASLGGKSTRTVVTSIEVLSSDGESVLMLDAIAGERGGGATIRMRKVWEASWEASGPSWTVSRDDATILSHVITGNDAQYSATKLASIETTDFRGANPNEANAKAVEAEVEARCSQLDIERAKAANLAEEKANLRLTLIAQHMDDKHVREYVGACPKCAGEPVNPDGTLADDEPVYGSDDNSDES